ncbi:MAG: MerR family transcriptional regulator [Aquabacterium sp.]
MDHRVDSALPPIPAKRYFTIGEVSELCLVKPYVLRYWEQEFVQLKPMKRRGNRRYYQHHEVLLIRRIRELLYEQGFTISGARNQLAELGVSAAAHDDADDLPDGMDGALDDEHGEGKLPMPPRLPVSKNGAADTRMSARALQANAPAMSDLAWIGPDLPDLQRLSPESIASLRESLLSIRDLLS